MNLARANWKRICERKLFHLTLDPGEMENRIQSPTYHVSALRMEKLLIRSLLRSSRLNTGTNEKTISDETKKQLKTLGYL